MDDGISRLNNGPSFCNGGCSSAILHLCWHQPYMATAEATAEAPGANAAEAAPAVEAAREAAEAAQRAEAALAKARAADVSASALKTKYLKRDLAVRPMLRATAVVAVAAAVLLLPSLGLQARLNRRRSRGVPSPPSLPGVRVAGAPGGRVFSTTDLQAIAKRQKPLLVVIVGLVYNVSDGGEYYARGESYHDFANGTDHSRAFLSGDYAKVCPRPAPTASSAPDLLDTPPDLRPSSTHAAHS